MQFNIAILNCNIKNTPTFIFSNISKELLIQKNYRKIPESNFKKAFATIINFRPDNFFYSFKWLGTT